jgi:chromosomal replication initiator protein
MKEWEHFLLFIETKKPGSLQNQWTTRYNIERFDAQNLYLSFQDVFSLNFFKEHIGPELKYFKNANNHPIKVHLELLANKIKTSNEQASKSVTFKFSEDTNLNFADFVCDEDNKFVLQMLMNLIDNTANFNPFYIYGAKSSGKTHLLKAAYNFYKLKGLRCLYVNADTFSEHVVYAMKSSSMNEFRKTYRNIDMLFFDDVQILGGKNATQEEFFHTFNSLHMSSKTIVLSSDTPASLLKNIEPRLISRFEWGLSVELSPLKKEHHDRLIDNLAARLDINITQDHKKTLKEHFGQDLSSLTAAIHTVELRSHLDKDESPSHVENTLEELKSQKKEITADDIVSSSAKFFGIKPKDIKGPSQTRPLAYPRQISMYLIRKHLVMPYKKMGEFYGRDHSTVMASVTIIEEKLKTLDEETLNAIKRIEWDLKS